MHTRVVFGGTLDTATLTSSARAEPLRTQRLSMDRTGADIFQRSQSLSPVYVSPSKLKGQSRLPSLPFEAHSRSTRSLLQSSQPPEYAPPPLDQRPGTSSSFMSGE